LANHSATVAHWRAKARSSQRQDSFGAIATSEHPFLLEIPLYSHSIRRAE
jgi:hypothetical protein